MEILNYCPDGGNGNFHCSSSFLKATSQICEAQLSFAAHQKYISFGNVITPVETYMSETDGEIISLSCSYSSANSLFWYRQ